RETGLPTPCNASRWASCLRCAAHPGYAGVGVPGELHHCRGRQHPSGSRMGRVAVSQEAFMAVLKLNQ
ncbi:hypothetical protein, partial [Synechococcus sp. BA-132 BA5]|uniref:hypothetical protein n=1 Tax=Synechococcus sp. BA-132 BA5 TaxID=3110252 RepID=UPI002B211ACA